MRQAERNFRAWVCQAQGQEQTYPGQPRHVHAVALDAASGGTAGPEFQDAADLSAWRVVAVEPAAAAAA